ncbi:MAG TPA: polysaccharide biosynthesis C-terminal domain-containing protein [Bacteroidia bacterium]|jgi:O-antigen/teichoic acid export membrane protein|nr:polysaccharide biosynthesis C-terminal domain-containing protein [Bacteroidia bacterium]
MGIVQKASIRLTIFSYLGAGLGYFNKILLFTNFLTVAQVGLISILTTISVLYAQVATLGISTVSIRFFPYFNDKDKQHHGFLFWTNCVVTVGFIISTIIFVFLKPFCIQYYRESPMLIDFYYYNIPLALGILYFQYLESYLRSLLKTGVATFTNELVGRVLVTVIIGMYALKLIDFHQFVVLYILCNAILALILLVYIAFLKQLFIKPVKSARFNRFFRIIIVYGIFTIMSALGGTVLTSIDSLMVTAKLGLGPNGIYSTVFLIAMVMTLPFRSIQKIAHPLLARYWKEKDMKGMADLYQKTSLIDMVLGGILFIGLWVNIDSIFMFMPKEYHSAKYVFLLLALSKYIDMATGLNGYIIVTSKKYKSDLWFMLLLIITTVILNLILIPIYGMMGAAIATLISISLYNILRLIFVYNYYHMQPFTINCLWVLVITIAVWVIAAQIPRLHSKYIDIAVRSVVMTVLYGGAILYFKLSSDVNDLVYSYTKIKYFATSDKK